MQTDRYKKSLHLILSLYTDRQSQWAQRGFLSEALYTEIRFSIKFLCKPGLLWLERERQIKVSPDYQISGFNNGSHQSIYL